MRHTLFTIAVIILLSFILFPHSAYAIETGPHAGKLAPEFELTDLSGKKVSLSEFKGKVVLLNFWATWCGPCKAEMAPLNDLYLSFKDRGFVVLAISVDTSEKPVQTFVKDRGIAFPVLMDKEKEAYFDLYAIFNLPASFLIDKNGIIVKKYIGEQDWNSAETRGDVLNLLNRK